MFNLLPNLLVYTMSRMFLYLCDFDIISAIVSCGISGLDCAGEVPRPKPPR